jgi:hypothetical protein
MHALPLRLPWLRPTLLVAGTAIALVLVTLIQGAYYHEFVQLERLKKNTQFGAKRTGFSVMANGRDGARDVV